MTWICSHCGEKFARYRTRCSSDGQRVIEDLSGQLIGGRYRIRELIGVGGMDSTVWKAWQTGTERVVAVKVLPAAEEAAARRFARGARIAANLNHPNCTVVHDYGRSEDGKLFLVMEFLGGQVLQDILGPEGMSVPDALHVTDQVLQALEHAHSQRAVHRDLKPDNLFLCRKNEDPLHVKILDFGIAKYVEEDPEHTASAEDGTPDSDGFEDLVTEQRQVCGTPQYMAPEQVVGARIDGRTDLYALGCVMYRMLTGRLPFDGKTRYELYQKHLQEPPRPFSEIRPDLVFPDRIELIVMKALSKRPDQRFQSASEMRKALETVELPDDRSRRSNRPRVSLKHTSPQERGSMPNVPTVLPGPLWTLSPAGGPPPLPGARSSEAPGVGYPGHSEHNPLIEVDPSMLGKNPGPMPGVGQASGPPLPKAASHLTLEDGRASLAAGASGVVLSPSLATQHGVIEGAGAAHGPSRGATRGSGRLTGAGGLLTDAVVRHPASRSPLAVAPEVPRSSETEPNKLADEGDTRRRRWTVAAVLGGAFLIGVGGVALVMKLSQPESPGPAEVTRAEGELAPEAPGLGAKVPGLAVGASPGHAEVEGQGQGVTGAVPPRTNPDEISPAEPNPTVGEQPSATEVRAAGTASGEALGGTAIAPRAEVVTIVSKPVGARVKLVGAPAGTWLTPYTTTLSPGKHSFEVSLDGHLPQTIEVIVGQEPSVAGRVGALEVVLAKRPATQPVRPPQTLQRTPTPAPTRPNLASPTTPPQTGPTTPDRVERPQVRLLEDEPRPGTPADKKPTVKLLEDDPAPPKKPQVKVLDD